MEFVIIIAVLIWLCWPKDKPRTQHTGGPGMIMRSDNGYEGHLDFLEMHGFISEEEREEQRRFKRDLKENPHKYKTMTLKELFEDYERKDSSKD